MFDFLLFDRKEFLSNSKVFSYWGVEMRLEQLELKAGSIAYTICQVPIILQASKEKCITITFTDGSIYKIEGHTLDPVNSNHIFQRSGVVHHLTVGIVP